MKNRPVESRIKGLRLPGDPANRPDRDQVRERFARGEGLDPRELTIYKDSESLLNDIQEKRVFMPTDGGTDLEESLKKLNAALEEAARLRRADARPEMKAYPEPQVMTEESQQKTKTPLWKRIIKSDVAPVSESIEYPDETTRDEEDMFLDETVQTQHDALTHAQSPESRSDASIDGGDETENSLNQDDSMPRDAIRVPIREDAGQFDASQSSLHDSGRVDVRDIDRVDVRDSGRVDVRDIGRIEAQDKPQVRTQVSARFATHEIARVYTEDQSQDQKPAIRRIEAERKDPPEPSYRAVEEGTAVFLSLAASQSDSISGTVTAPMAEPAVTMATSRLPKITKEHLDGTNSDGNDHNKVTNTGEDVHERTEENGNRASRLDHLTRSTLILIVGLILSKLTGQIRQVLYPHVFVQKHLTDAYVQGFLIPDFIYELLVGGSIQAAIVPTLASALGTKEERKTWHSVSIFISFVSVIMLLTLVIAEVFTPQLLAPFVKIENLELTARMARVLFPQTFFMMGAALSIGIINAYSNFIKTSFGPAIYNSLFAASLLILGTSSEQGLIHVGIGVSLSALAYFLFQIFLGRKEISPYRFRLDLKDRGFRLLLLLAVPILFSSSIAHLNTMVLHGFTKSMEAGAATALNQANSVWLLPYGVFTVAIGQAMLPTLSTLIGREKDEAASSLLSASIRRMLFFAIPSAITFFILREDLMLGIFIWRFDGYDAQIEVTRLAARLLQWYCISIVVQGFIYLYNYAFYAMKVTYLPLINGIISLVLTLAVGSYITQPNVLGAEGLSVSYALSGTMTALILGILFKLRFRKLAPRFLTRAWGIFFVKMIPMTVVMVGALYLMETYFTPAAVGGKIQQIVWLGLRFGVAFGIWFIGGKLFKLDLKVEPQTQKKAAL